MPLPNQSMDAVPFTPLTAAFLDDMIENIEALAAGTGMDTTAVLLQSNPYKFRARRTTSLTLGSSLSQKIVFNLEDYDTNNNFDTTNGRYTIPVDGFYQFNAHVNAGASTVGFITLYKNGSEYQRGQQTAQSGYTLSDSAQASAGDYFEIFVFYDGTSPVVVSSGVQPVFSGYLVSRT